MSMYGYVYIYVCSCVNVYNILYLGRSYLLKRPGIVASLLKNTRRVYVYIRALYIKPKSLALHVLCRNNITIIIYCS